MQRDAGEVEGEKDHVAHECRPLDTGEKSFALTILILRARIPTVAPRRPAIASTTYALQAR